MHRRGKPAAPRPPRRGGRGPVPLPANPVLAPAPAPHPARAHVSAIRGGPPRGGADRGPTDHEKRGGAPAGRGDVLRDLPLRRPLSVRHPGGTGGGPAGAAGFDRRPLSRGERRGDRARLVRAHGVRPGKEAGLLRSGGQGRPGEVPAPRRPMAGFAASPPFRDRDHRPGRTVSRLRGFRHRLPSARGGLRVPRPRRRARLRGGAHRERGDRGGNAGIPRRPHGGDSGPVRLPGDFARSGRTCIRDHARVRPRHPARADRGARAVPYRGAVGPAEDPVRGNGSMTLRIAVAGKGGVGKTTCSALLLRALVRSGVRPLLAVDADPNMNLHLLLSLPLPRGVGSLREEQRTRVGGAVPLTDRIISEVHRRLSEGDVVDLVAMGRGEGPGCYCYVNNLLREALDRIEGGYRAVVVDNEAGMEHLSRRSGRRIDHLVLVGVLPPRGPEPGAPLRELATELALPVGKTWLLLNRPYGAPGRGTPDGRLRRSH